VDPFAGTVGHSLVSVPEDDCVFEGASADEGLEDVGAVAFRALASDR
jgi:hypothetical protein